MELNLKLNKIQDDEYNNLKLYDVITVTNNFKENLLKKRRTFAQRLKNLKKHVISNANKNAFKTAKEDFFDKFLSTNNLYKKAIENANKDCLNLSINIAKEIIQKEVKSDKDILLFKIQTELRKIRDKNNYKIICNKDCEEEIKDRIKNIEIITDEFIPQSIVYLSSSAGSIEINIENEFDFLSNKLREDLKNLC